jgi:hypothetical protein
MDLERPDEAVAELLNGMNKGQYLLLAEAIRQLGGTMTLDWSQFLEAAARPPQPMGVDATDGPVVLRLH